MHRNKHTPTHKRNNKNGRTLNAERKGNVARFMLHSCEPNLKSFYVLPANGPRIQSMDKDVTYAIPRILFFALRCRYRTCLSVCLSDFAEQTSLVLASCNTAMCMLHTQQY